MNEKLQYASMLEIPVSTCSVTVKEGKKLFKRKKKEVNPDVVKEKLITKVNLSQENQEPIKEPIENILEQPTEQVDFEQKETVSIEKKVKKSRSKISIIGTQFIIIGVLVATIFLTNAFYPDSGINVFMREVFGSNSGVEQVDERSYDQFAPVLALDEQVSVTLSDGVIGFTGESSVYAPCDGTVAWVSSSEDGSFSMEITHSTNFSTVINGLEHVYVSQGDKVFSNVPVGYSAENGGNLCFKDASGSLISDYKLVEQSVVWEA
ncbi:MAG: peptidoglycan DD-metalloendopeptidase family protein [Clostridia bacterium]|nr:peptidoglycan DD-metalloendopeptidase family protein [Clostridia bacterium]